jgi:hypothetical protein
MHSTGLSDAASGALIGAVLVAVSCVLLWWNEGNYVRGAKALKKVFEQAVELRALGDAKNVRAGTIVCVTGKATAVTDLALSDSTLKVQASSGALRLQRKVEFYVWKETSKSTSKKEMGGAKTTTTEYTYTRDWCPSPINSQSFKKNPALYRNPDVSSFPLRPEETWNAAVELEDTGTTLTLTPELIDHWHIPPSHWQDLGVKQHRNLRLETPSGIAPEVLNSLALPVQKDKY